MMRRLAMPLLMFAVTLGPMRAVASPTYEEALAAIEQGRCSEAVDILTEVIVQRPPGLEGAGTSTTAYVPYYYMSLCQYLMGDRTTARTFYRLAARRGVVTKVKDLQASWRLLGAALDVIDREKTEDLLAPLPAGSPTGQPGHGVLDGDCTVVAAPDPYNSAWFSIYAQAVDLIGKGLHEEGLALLERALMKNDQPNPKARSYGMWFLAYRPYYHMARAFMALGRKDCARRAAEASQAYHEVGPDDDVAADWALLRKELGLP